MSQQRVSSHRNWWALGLVGFVVAFFAVAGLMFNGAFVRSVGVTVVSNRAGLVMESGAKVKLRGVQVGKVAAVKSRPDGVSLRLELRPELVKYMPANIEAQIRTTTVFGAKFVDLVVPDRPDEQRLRAGAVIASRNVTTEVNTVFENLTAVLDQVEPEKLNAVVSALSDALRGKGERLGQATAAGLDVVVAVNGRMDTLQRLLKATAAVSNTYSTAADDLIATLSALTTTSATIANQSSDLQAALLGTIGLAGSGIDLLGPTQDNFVNAVNKLPVTTGLLNKYSPTYTCMLQGAFKFITEGHALDTNGRSATSDSTILSLAQDPYRYPDNLPIIAAKGGPDGKPGCGSLPDVAQNMPVRYLVTNTGFGTGVDIRPNPGIGHPFFTNYFPVTKGVPEAPRIYGDGPPAIGPVPYPGAPPYGAPLFAPDGTPLWAPPPPGQPAPPVPGVSVLPAPYGPGPQPAPVAETRPNPPNGAGS